MTLAREIACAVLLDTRGYFIMQRRDNIPDIVYPGMISLFGGHREENESFLECVAREISEELTYVIPPEDFTHLVSLREGIEENLARGRVA